MDKRYQVFVSSTYKDLMQERIEVIQALLELDCIPSGMEYFPAADETQWEFIKKLIDESDYYIVIIAGMYGSVDENGTSFTQKEYEYALSKGIPAIGFLHKDIDILPSSKTEKDKDRINRLNQFNEVVKKKLCKFWSSPQELGAVVSRSISQAKKNYPRTGWVRADSTNVTSEKEMVQLYKKIDSLEQKLKESSEFIKMKSLDLENLADGEDKLAMQIDIKSGSWNSPESERKIMNISWDEINYQLLPKLVDPLKMTSFKGSLNSIAKEIYLNRNLNIKLGGNMSISVSTDFLETVKIQLQLLGLIKFYKDEITKGEETKTINIITLTDKGKEKLLKLRAVKR